MAQITALCGKLPEGDASSPKKTLAKSPQNIPGAISGYPLEAADGDPRQQASAWAGYRAFLSYSRRRRCAGRIEGAEG